MGILEFLVGSCSFMSCPNSGMYPEHTRLAYEKAFDQNADFVECDVTITKVGRD